MKHQYLENDLLEKVVLQFTTNPKLSSDKLLKFCQEEKISLQDFSSIMYHLLVEFFNEGESMYYEGVYNPSQLAIGTKVEHEHTTSHVIAKKIAMDHLAELPDYYARLAEMEKG